MSAPMDAWDGRPEQPERNGWHWVQDADDGEFCAYWFAQDQRWTGDGLAPDEFIASQRELAYLGPALLPTDIAALQAKVREAALREAAWIAQERMSEGGEYALAAKHIHAAILALIPQQETHDGE